ncbi:unnamed protein product [Brassica napus]|uniref:(rape) hypothetical protein n=1 Tax=Brassica napus TaxID=3708 RepID=A0A816VNI0_BRANA|nr:unnamed protein product [Brassica napus]
MGVRPNYKPNMSRQNLNKAFPDANFLILSAFDKAGEGRKHGANEECREVQTAVRMQIRYLRLLVDNPLESLYFKTPGQSVCRKENYRPSKEQLASHVGVSKEKLDKLLSNTRTPLSMQQPIWSDQDTTFQEVTPDSGIDTPAMSVGKQMTRNHVRNIFNVLSPKERRIIKLRFGIGGGKQRSLSEIGEIYGRSKERVRQLESRALYKLKQNMNIHGLSAYADFLV